MNKKIKELGEKAGFVPWDNEPWNPGDVFDWSSRYDDALQKFAELIINECGIIADDYRDIHLATKPSDTMKIVFFGKI